MPRRSTARTNLKENSAPSSVWIRRIRKRNARTTSGGEIQAGQHLKPAVEPKHSQPRAVVQRGVLVRPHSTHVHELDVDLDELTGRCLLEQLELPRRAPAFRTSRSRDAARF